MGRLHSSETLTRTLQVMILKSVGTNFAFNALAVVVGFVNTIALARYVVIDDYGKFTSLVTMCAVLAVIGDFGLSHAGVVYSNQTEERRAALSEFYLFISTHLQKLGIFSLLGLIATIFYLNITQISEVLFLVIVPLSIAFVGFINVTNQVENRWINFGRVNLSLNLIRSSGLITLWILDIFSYNSVLILFVCASILHVVTAWLITKPKVINRLSKPNDYLLKKYALNFVLINFITVLASKSDIVVGHALLTENELGLYSGAFVLASFLPVLTNSINQVLLRNIGNSVHLLRSKSIYRLASLLVAITIILIWSFSGLVFNFIFSGKYNDSLLIFKSLASIHTLGLLFTPFESLLVNNNQNALIKVKLVQGVILYVLPLLIYSFFGWYSLVIAVGTSRLVGWSLIVAFTKKAYVVN